MRAQRAALNQINRTVGRLADQLIEQLDVVIRDETMRESRDAQAAAKDFIQAGGTKEEWEEIFIRVQGALQQELERIRLVPQLEPGEFDLPKKETSGTAGRRSARNCSPWTPARLRLDRLSDVTSGITLDGSRRQ